MIFMVVVCCTYQIFGQTYWSKISIFGQNYFDKIVKKRFLGKIVGQRKVYFCQIKIPLLVSKNFGQKNRFLGQNCWSKNQTFGQKNGFLINIGQNCR